MTRDTIHSKVCELSARYAEHPFDDQKVRHFAAALRDQADEEVFHGVYPIFLRSGYEQNGTWEQEVAGKLLVLRRPAPQLDLDRLIADSAPHYNLSIEEYPWYLALCFGRERFRERVTELLVNADTATKRALETFLWWTSITEEKIEEELRPLDERFADQ